MSTEHTLAENLLRLQSATEDIADAIAEKGGTASYSDGLEAMGDKIRAIPNPQPVLTTKTIVQNGTYRAEDDAADGYSEVTANVPNTYTASDEGKVVSNGALVSQGSDAVTENGTVDTTLIGSLTVNVESGGVNTGTAEYISNSSYYTRGAVGAGLFSGSILIIDQIIYYARPSGTYGTYNFTGTLFTLSGITLPKNKTANIVDCTSENGNDNFTLVFDYINNTVQVKYKWTLTAYANANEKQINAKLYVYWI